MSSAVAIATAGVVVVVVGAAVTTPRPVAAAPFSAAPRTSALEWGVVVEGNTTRSHSAAFDSAAPGLVARTQLISEAFDQRWAGAVHDGGGTPWVTLQFDTAQQRESGLIAIENGAFDARLRQWANSVREYASPLVVTVLPQADADWAVSSAVAGGGVPADASAAWRHVRDLFAKAGASNAAFAWAPARAGDDEQFAPPKGSTDAVVVTELRLNGTAWPNVSSALDLAAEAHPGAPLILVLGAVGDSEQKATWLRDALAQAAARPRVEAVVYHEAAPGSSGDDPAEDWSASSDPATTKVMQAFLRTAADGDVTRKAVLNAAESAR